MNRRSMRSMLIRFATLVSMLAAVRAGAQGIRYLTWDGQAQRAAIETSVGIQWTELGA